MAFLLFNEEEKILTADKRRKLSANRAMILDVTTLERTNLKTTLPTEAFSGPLLASSSSHSCENL